MIESNDVIGVFSPFRMITYLFLLVVFERNTLCLKKILVKYALVNQSINIQSWKIPDITTCSVQSHQRYYLCPWCLIVYTSPCENKLQYKNSTKLQEVLFLSLGWLPLRFFWQAMLAFFLRSNIHFYSHQPNQYNPKCNFSHRLKRWSNIKRRRFTHI